MVEEVFLKQPRHLWNTGITQFSLLTWLHVLNDHLKQMNKHYILFQWFPRAQWFHSMPSVNWSDQTEQQFPFPQSDWELWNFSYVTGPRNGLGALLLSQVVAMDPGVSSLVFYFFASNFLLKMMHALLKNGREVPQWSVQYLVHWVLSAGRAWGELVYPAERSHYESSDTV